jgi:hypothetical protein
LSREIAIKIISSLSAKRMVSWVILSTRIDLNTSTSIVEPREGRLSTICKKTTAVTFPWLKQILLTSLLENVQMIVTGRGMGPHSVKNTHREHEPKNRPV